MAFPDVAVKIALASAPGTDPPTWTEITTWRSIQIQRGRATETDRFPAASATIIFDDRLRELDPFNTAGPYYGNLQPMKRIRVESTYAAVPYVEFDGYTDGYVHDYDGSPEGDARCTVRASDAFKILAAADLPSSVYALEVARDNPAIWWRLEEPDGVTTVTNSGSVGPPGDGTVIGSPNFGEPGLIDRDSGTALATVDDSTNNGVWLDLDQAGLTVGGGQSFAVEFWVERRTSVGAETFFDIDRPAGGTFACRTSDVDNKLYWLAVNDAFTIQWGVRSSITIALDTRYHVVAVHNNARALKLYINGVDVSEADPGSSGSTTVGAITPRYLRLGHSISTITNVSPNATFDEFAVYVATGSDPLVAADWAEHNGFGRTPWTGDTGAARINRLLDYIGWPATLRALDTGTTLQAPDLAGSTVLDQIQRVADADFGAVFVNAAGKIVFYSRSTLWTRTSLATFGDDPTNAAELGYENLQPNYSDTDIHNDVTVSRSEGGSYQASDAASIGAYLRHPLVLDGLVFADTGTLARDAANFILNRDKDPHRWINQITILPLGSNGALGATEALLMPQALGRELLERITVKDRPPGGGAANSQVCVIEGVSHSITPVSVETTWNLAPALPTSPVGAWDVGLWDQAVWGF